MIYLSHNYSTTKLYIMCLGKTSSCSHANHLQSYYWLQCFRIIPIKSLKEISLLNKWSVASGQILVFHRSLTAQEHWMKKSSNCLDLFLLGLRNFTYRVNWIVSIASYSIKTGPGCSIQPHFYGKPKFLSLHFLRSASPDGDGQWRGLKHTIFSWR